MGIEFVVQNGTRLLDLYAKKAFRSPDRKPSSNAASPADFRKFFECGPGLYLVLNPEFTIVAVSDAYLTATATQREQLLGSRLFDIFVPYPGDAIASHRMKLKESLETVMRTHAPNALPTQKFALRLPSSIASTEGGRFEERYWRSINSPIFDKDGTLSFIIHRVEDVTELTLATEKLRHADMLALAHETALRKRELQASLHITTIAREQAEKASRAKNTFLSLISHEIHTPLTAILLTLRIIEKRNLLAGGLPLLRRLKNSSLRLKTIVDSLLEYTSIERGKLLVTYDTIDPRALASEVILEVDGPAREKGLNIFANICPKMVRLETDLRLTRVILNNLLSNAVKYTRAGSVELSIREEADQQIFEVRDTGSGIPPEDRTRIFEPFEQLQELSQKSIPGVGMGLALVREIVTALGGSVEVQSQMGVGSAFRVLLPHPRYGAPSMPFARCTVSRPR